MRAVASRDRARRVGSVVTLAEIASESRSCYLTRGLTAERRRRRRKEGDDKKEKRKERKKMSENKRERQRQKQKYSR